jgi:hypothetical protein
LTNDEIKVVFNNNNELRSIIWKTKTPAVTETINVFKPHSGTETCYHTIYQRDHHELECICNNSWWERIQKHSRHFSLHHDSCRMVLNHEKHHQHAMQFSEYGQTLCYMDLERYAFAHLGFNKQQLEEKYAYIPRGQEEPNALYFGFYNPAVVGTRWSKMPGFFLIKPLMQSNMVFNNRPISYYPVSLVVNGFPVNEKGEVQYGEEQTMIVRYHNSEKSFDVKPINSNKDISKRFNHIYDLLGWSSADSWALLASNDQQELKLVTSILEKGMRPTVDERILPKLEGNIASAAVFLKGWGEYQVVAATEDGTIYYTAFVDLEQEG